MSPGRTLRVPCTLMRGGTSRGLVFRREDLPRDESLWDRIFLAALGSPDARQLDGVGAGDSHTSKIAVLSACAEPEADVDYLFGEVGIREARVDYAGNSGNIISALGLYAIEEGMVAAVEPETTVRVRNLNTGKLTELRVPVADGAPSLDGDFHVDGVPGTAPRIDMVFPWPEGAVTGALLPTGAVRETLDVPGAGALPVSLVDAANPVVLVPGEALGVSAATGRDALNDDAALLERLQAVRAAGAARMGLVERVEDAWEWSAMIPFLVLLFPPADYPSYAEPGATVAGADMDLCTRVVSLGMIHKSINVTVSVAVTAAALVPGSLADELSGGCARERDLRIGHPSGVVRTRGVAGPGGASQVPERIESVRLGRTARRIMEGAVLVQPHKLRHLEELMGPVGAGGAVSGSGK